MAALLRVPEVATGATEAVLSQWLVEENAPFVTGQPIVLIETEKAVVEVEADTDAVVLRRLAQGGSTVEIGSPMALIGEASERGSDLDQLLAELGVRPVGESPAAEPPASSGSARVFITPIARRLLTGAGLSPAGLAGSGPNGRILRRDAERAVAASRASRNTAAGLDAAPDAPTVPAVPAASAGLGAGFELIPHSRLRRAVASRLTTSKQSIPHFYLKRTARIDALLDLRSRLNEVSPQRISVNDLVLRAVAAAHVRVPDANVIWTEDGIRKFDSVDIAVAIASGRGLVTPVLRGVQNTSPSAIAAQVSAYVRQANEGRLRQRDLEGGSISVSNLGMYGVEEFAAIINPPHSAVLAVGAGRAEPVVAGSAIEVGTVMSLVLSVDHRAVDGALAAEWMAALVTSIEEPLRLLA